MQSLLIRNEPNNLQRRFNNNEVDVLMISQSGSKTGIAAACYGQGRQSNRHQAISYKEKGN